MKNKNIKGVRLIVAAIVLFFIIFVILRIYFEESKNFSPLALKSNTVIFGLWIIIILFGLTFLFILARNILKMYLEKNQGGAGAQLQEPAGLFLHRLLHRPHPAALFLRHRRHLAEHRAVVQDPHREHHEARSMTSRPITTATSTRTSSTFRA